MQTEAHLGEQRAAPSNAPTPIGFAIMLIKRMRGRSWGARNELIKKSEVIALLQRVVYSSEKCWWEYRLNTHENVSGCGKGKLAAPNGFRFCPYCSKPLGLRPL